MRNASQSDEEECRGADCSYDSPSGRSSLAYCHRVIRLNGKDNGSNL